MYWLFLPACFSEWWTLPFPGRVSVSFYLPLPSTCPTPRVSSMTPTSCPVSSSSDWQISLPTQNEEQQLFPHFLLLSAQQISPSLSFLFFSWHHARTVSKLGGGGIWVLQDRSRFQSQIYYIWVSLGEFLTPLSISFPVCEMGILYTVETLWLQCKSGGK